MTDENINSLGGSFLACPLDKTGLQSSTDGKAYIAESGARYSIQNGVANFLPSQDWETPGNEHLRQLLKLAREQGYLNAIEHGLVGKEYITDLSRTIYLDLFALDKNVNVLEIGASLGQHTKIIAGQCRHVEALEVIPEQALFASECCRQEGFSNVNVSIGGSECQLPYQSAVFDIVIMNYVLEWSAGRLDMDPGDAHQLLITECNRVLKPGGKLFLSTKNRFNLRLLTGEVDEHVEFRFGNALPRWLMRLLIKRRPPSKSMGYLHSFSELRDILDKAGFSVVKPLLALPDGRFPLVYTGFSTVELNQLKHNSALLSSGRMTRYIVKYLPHWAKKWIAPSLVFIAEK